MLTPSVDETQVWPPREPDSIRRGPAVDLTSASPFVYGEDSLNPALTPSNMRRRSNGNSKPAHALPPYHPDYKEGEFVTDPQAPEDNSEDSDEYVEPPPGRVRMRRGSEGYEVMPQSRDEMLRRYIEDLGEDPHRYVRYEPEPFSESEDEDDGDNVPLARMAVDAAKRV